VRPYLVLLPKSSNPPPTKKRIDAYIGTAVAVEQRRHGEVLHTAALTVGGRVGLLPVNIAPDANARTSAGGRARGIGGRVPFLRMTPCTRSWVGW